MNAKETKIILVCDSLGEREFEIEHANRLLAMKPNGGWRLPDDCGYTYTERNGIERTGNKGKVSKAEKGECDK